MKVQYDFLTIKKGWFSLSSDGKKPRIIIICGYNADTFNVLGENNLLKNEALKCYNDWRKCE